MRFKSLLMVCHFRRSTSGTLSQVVHTAFAKTVLSYVINGQSTEGVWCSGI